MKKVTRTYEKTVYVASDGKEFDSMDDCEWHEKELEQEELEEENRELNMEIGTYSSKIDEIQRSIGVKLADLKILSTQMLKGDSK